jgi:type I restriction enzyme S subunit
VRVPELASQRKVAAILGTLDDLIENNRRRIQVLEEMAKAIYREWFVRFRFPGHDDSRLVDSLIGHTPEGWQVTELRDVADVNRASRIPCAGKEVVYLDISCLGDSSLEVPDAIDGGDAPGRARRIVSAGDVLWSMVRPNRRAHVLLVDPRPEYIASTGLAVLSPTAVPSSFLFEAVSTRAFSDYLVAKESGAAYPAVRPGDFEAAPIVVPPADLLKQFHSVVSPCHRLAWELREQSRTLSRIRNLLLPKLVTGQIDVSRLDLGAVSEVVP